MVLKVPLDPWSIPPHEDTCGTGQVAEIMEGVAGGVVTGGVVGAMVVGRRVVGGVVGRGVVRGWVAKKSTELMVPGVCGRGALSAFEICHQKRN